MSPAPRSPLARPAEHSGSPGQWAKIPEWVAYKQLNATEWNVLIILAAKAGRDRIAWISQRTIAILLGVRRQTVTDAIRKLKKVGVLEEAGVVVVDRQRGTWVKKYRIIDTCLDQPEVQSDRATGEADARLDRATGEAPADPMHGFTGPDARFGGPDARPHRAHSVPQYSVPQESVDASSDVQTEQPNPNGDNPAANDKPIGFWFKREFHYLRGHEPTEAEEE